MGGGALCLHRPKGAGPAAEARDPWDEAEKFLVRARSAIGSARRRLRDEEVLGRPLDQRKKPNASGDLAKACLNGPGAPGGGGVLCLHPGCAASARGGSPARVEEQKISWAALAEKTESARRAVDPARPEDVLRPLLVRGGRIKLPGPNRDSAAARRRDRRSRPRGLEQLSASRAGTAQTWWMPRRPARPCIARSGVPAGVSAAQAPTAHNRASVRQAGELLMIKGEVPCSGLPGRVELAHPADRPAGRTAV